MGRSESSESRRGGKGGSSAPAYGMGVLGALVFYLPEADTFGEILWGIALSMFWPAVLVHEALKALVGSF